MAVGLVELGRLDLELLDPLLVEVAVGDDLLELAIQQLEHLAVFRAQRAGAGGAVALGAGLHDPLPLVLELLVLIEQPLPLGPRILGIAHPRRAQRLAVERHAGERRPEVAHPLAGGLDQGRRGQARQPVVDRAQMAADILELCQESLPRRVGFGLPLEGADLLSQHGQRRKTPRDRFEPRRRGRGLGGLALQPLDALRRRGHLMAGDAELRLERERRLPKLLQPFPAGAHVRHTALGLARGGGCSGLGGAGGGNAGTSAGLGGVDIGEIAQAGAEGVVACA